MSLWSMAQTSRLLRSRREHNSEYISFSLRIIAENDDTLWNTNSRDAVHHQVTIKICYWVPSTCTEIICTAYDITCFKPIFCTVQACSCYFLLTRNYPWLSFSIFASFVVWYGNLSKKIKALSGLQFRPQGTIKICYRVPSRCEPFCRMELKPQQLTNWKS